MPDFCRSCFKALYRAVLNCPKHNGVTQLEIMELPSELVDCFNQMARNNCITITDFAEHLNLTQRQANYLARMLTKKGFLRTETRDDLNVVYRINYRQRTTRRRNTSTLLDMLTNDDA